MPDDDNVVGSPISDELFDALPFVSIEAGTKMANGLPTRIDEAPNVKSLGLYRLRKLFRTRSPWE